MALRTRPQHSVPPEQAAYYQMLYERMSCRPPVKRNYFPVIGVAFAAGIGTMIYFIVTALT